MLLYATGRHTWVSGTEGAGQSGIQGEQLGDGQILLLHCHGRHTGEPASPGDVRQLRSDLGGSLQVHLQLVACVLEGEELQRSAPFS